MMLSQQTGANFPVPPLPAAQVAPAAEETIDELLFGDELFFPFDVTVRRVEPLEYALIEKGLAQRLTAINSLLADLYTEQRILKAGLLPPQVLEQLAGWFKPGIGRVPPKGIYVHLASFDLIRGRDKRFYIQRDNLVVPTGAPYPAPQHPLDQLIDAPVLTAPSATQVSDYDQLVRDALTHAAQDGIQVILSHPLGNPLFFEHAYLADRTRSELAFPELLSVQDNAVYYRYPNGPRVKVGAIFCSDSEELVQVSGADSQAGHLASALLDAYRAGRVAILNAPGSKLAEAPEIFHRMPEIIQFYTGEKAVLDNVPAYRTDHPQDLEIVLSRLDHLVIKEILPQGGFRIVQGRDLDPEARTAWCLRLSQESSRFVVQEVIDFTSFDTLDAEGHIVPRQADFRVHVSQGRQFRVWNTGL